MLREGKIVLPPSKLVGGKGNLVLSLGKEVLGNACGGGATAKAVLPEANAGLREGKEVPREGNLVSREG